MVLGYTGWRVIETMSKAASNLRTAISADFE